MEVKAFEKSPYLGGNWKIKDPGVSVFRNTELTSSKYVTAFSDEIQNRKVSNTALQNGT